MQSPREIVVLRYQLTAEDFRQSAQDFGDRQSALYLVRMLVAAGFLLGGLHLLGGSFYHSVIFAAALSALMALLLWYRFKVAPGVLYKKYREASPGDLDVTLFFSDEDIRIQTDQSTAKVAWDYFDEITEARHNYFLLKGNRTMLRAVPKRAFEDREQEAAFRALAERKLGPIKAGLVKKRK